jgi:membrane-bound metal-dependent hydrolase YbcI (DUF457 family)
MPFTPFHFGPALGFGLPLRKYLHVPTFMLANVILDIEPFLVLILGLNIRLHGYSHTFIMAFVVGFGLGYVMFLLERFFSPLYKTLLLEKEQMLNIKPFMLAGVLGALLHVLLDSPLYSDIQPFYPLIGNPLYNSTLLDVYSICLWMGVLGIVFYVYLLVLFAHNRFTVR